MQAPPDPTVALRDALSLFDQWLALPEADRAVWLAGLEKSQPALLPPLKAMILADQQAEAKGFLAQPAPLPADTPPPDHSGLRFGPWELQEQIGSGGMGEVWRARRSDGLYAGQAAVKLQRSTRANPLADARFAREAEFLARVSHPHIAQLLDAGVAPDGTRYLVLEYVKGERVDTWCDRRRLDVEARLALMLQLCAAVAFAHAQQVVHRDLKPSNILVTEQGHVKLLDFGVAKLLDPTEGSAAELTRLGAAGLTPEYAAPEQVDGGAVTAATDVYALGVLLFVLLSGQRPYGDPRSSAAQLARDIVETEPLRLSAAFGSAGAVAEAAAGTADARGSTPRALRQRLRGDLEHIVAKALRKVPAERYASAQALADDIGRHLRHEPVLAQAPTLLYRAAKFARRQRVVLGAAAVLVLALAAGGGELAAAVIALAVAAGVGATLWQAKKAREQAALARTEAANATAIKDFLLGVFGSTGAGDGDIAAKRNTTAQQLVERGAQRVLADTALAPAARLELITLLSEMHEHMEIDAPVEGLQAAALDLARTVHGTRSEKYVYALVERGLSLSDPRAGRRAEGDALLQQAVQTMEQVGQTATESYPVALWQRGVNAHHDGRLADSMALLRRSVDAYAAHQPTHAMRATALRWLGNAHSQHEEFVLARACYEQARDVSAGQDKMRDFGIATARYALGDLATREGHFADAVPELEAARALHVVAIGPRHTNVGYALILLGRSLHQLGHGSEGRARLDEALAIGGADNAQPGGVTDLAQAMLARMGVDDGDVDAALALAHAVVERRAPSANPAWAAALATQAELLLLAGKPQQALADFDTALPLLDKTYGRDSIACKQAHLARAEALEAAGQAGSARAVYDDVLSPGRTPINDALPVSAWLHARARCGQSRLLLADDAAAALAMARSAASSLPPAPEARRDNVALAQARLVESQALRALGDSPGASDAQAAALALLQRWQVPQSPRLRFGDATAPAPQGPSP